MQPHILHRRFQVYSSDNQILSACLLIAMAPLAYGSHIALVPCQNHFGLGFRSLKIVDIPWLMESPGLQVSES